MEDFIIDFDDSPAQNIVRDSLHCLPLNMIPLETPGLRKARLVKNAKFETMLELYSGDTIGSAQTDPHHLTAVFPSNMRELNADQPKINALSSLNSFDVYSLRISMRRLGIDISDDRQLELSPETRKKLADYMQEFTRPLIQEIFTQDDQGAVHQLNDLVSILKSPNKKEVLQNLQTMSQKLDIGVMDIPRFLEDYSDIFLSVSYFRSNLDETWQDLEAYLHWSRHIFKQNYVSTEQKQALDVCKKTNITLTEISKGMEKRLDTFHARFAYFWSDLSMHSFHDIRNLVTESHENLGGVLCGLNVKMQNWKDWFPEAREASASRTVDFIITEMAPGIDRIKKLYDDAPKLSH